MFDKNIYSMLDFAKKIAQRERDPEDWAYEDVAEQGPEVEGRHVTTIGEEGEEIIPQEEILGFTQTEIADIEENARTRGLRDNYMPTLSAVIDSINEEVNNGWKRKVEALKEIEGYIVDLLEVQKTQPVQTPVIQTPPEEEELVPGPLAEEPEEEIPAVENVPQENVPTEDDINAQLDETIQGEPQDIEVPEGVPEAPESIIEPPVEETPTPEETAPEVEPAEENRGITPEEAAETAKSIKLPETVEELGQEDVSKYPIAYEKGGNVMAKQNIFRVTPQSEKMLQVFGKENLVGNPMFDKAAGWVSKGLKLRYYIGDVDISEIKAALYRNLMNAMSVLERYDPRSGTTSKETDYRLKVFVDKPELLPVEMQPDWQKLEGYFEQELARRQAASVAEGKDPQKKLYDITKSEIIERSGMAPNFIVALNKLINSGDPRILEPIYKEATYLTTYELGHRERGDRPMPQMVGEEGEQQDISELGLPATKEKITTPTVVDVKQNQASFGKSAQMVSGFVDDVWDSLGRSTSDPETYAKFDKIRLKMELFKQQSQNLFGTDASKYNTANDRVYNEEGTVIWNRQPKEVVVRQPDGKMKVVALDTTMKDIISKEAFRKNYVSFLKMKFDINKVAAGTNLNTPEGIAAVKNAVIAQNPEAGNPAFAAFLNDPKFVQMAARQNQQEIVAEYQKVASDPKQARIIDDAFLVIWGQLAADSLIAVAKRTKQLQAELANKSEVERKQAIDDFVRARQNYISAIGVHSTLLDDMAKPKLGTNSKLKALFKISLSAREIMQMIAGYKEIPAAIMDRLSSHKYEAASRIYDNMLNKIAKLEKIKMASVDIPMNYMEDIIRNAMEQITTIMG